MSDWRTYPVDLNHLELMGCLMSLHREESQDGLSEPQRSAVAKLEPVLGVALADLRIATEPVPQGGTDVSRKMQLPWGLEDIGTRPTRTLALEMLGYLDTILLREFLAPEGERPDPTECVWLTDAPGGPDPDGIAAVLAATAEYGSENVTTGNANPPVPGSNTIGIYVRRAAMREQAA